MAFISAAPACSTFEHNLQLKHQGGALLFLTRGSGYSYFFFLLDFESISKVSNRKQQKI